MVKLAFQPGDSVARITREHDINDNLLFKWPVLRQNEGRISRCFPVTISSVTGVEILPEEIIPDEQNELMGVLAPPLYTPS
ncbi:transposase [Escherichia coli]|nr:transposase [Escherichia coli]ELO5003734.1 transposase [Escherichia coli]